MFENKKIFKIAAISFLISVTIIFALLFIFWPRDFSAGKKPIYGVNFSQKYAEELNTDWKKTYLAILNELKPKKIRISAHWDTIEKKRDVFDFSELDWQIKEAGEKNIKIILAIGRRTPRWPECHDPVWLERENPITSKKHILNLLKEIINRYKNNSTIIYWQVENEPLLDVFGDCPKSDIEFLEQEIALIKKLDKRPIMLTVSGELSTWTKLSKKADILGTSLYRTVWNPRWKFFSYPLPTSYYHYKSELIKKLNPKLQKVIISELQGEAWGGNTSLSIMPIKEQLAIMNEAKLKNIASYAKKTGIPEIYFWGAEWWYFLKQKGYSQMWNTAREIIK